MIRLPVRIDDRWGYIDEHGAISIPPSFTYANCFWENLAIVKLDPQTLAIIDQIGRVIGSVPNAGSYSNYSDGLLQYHLLDDDWTKGYIDRHAQVVIPPKFSRAAPFADGMAVVAIGEKYGAIDREGKFVIPPRFDFLHPFQKGQRVSAYLQDGLWGLVNRAGKIVLKPTFESALVTAEGRTPACLPSGNAERRYGFVDDVGEWLVSPRFGYCGASFHGDTIPVEVDDRWGVVDLEGNWVIAPTYTCTDSFFEGLSRVYVGGDRDLDYCLINGKFGYIDRTDTLVIPAQFDSASDFNNGVAQIEEFYVDNEGRELSRYGWIDKTGRQIWKPS